jgi:hypothetical protein
MGAEPTLKKPSKQGHKDVTLPTKFVPRFFADADQRIGVVKLIRKRCKLIREHAGGEESIQRSLLCDRLAFISIWLESQEVAAAEGRPFEAGSYVQSVNAMQGLLKTLGLEKRIRNVTDLRSYLKEKDANENH